MKEESMEGSEHRQKKRKRRKGEGRNKANIKIRKKKERMREEKENRGELKNREERRRKEEKITYLYIPGIVVGQSKGGAAHTPLTHRPYRQSLLAVHTVPTTPLAVTIAVEL
jgi:hypothetical protein